MRLRAALVSLLLVTAPAAAQNACPPGQSRVLLHVGPGTEMAAPGYRTSARCMTRRQIARLRPGYGCLRPDRRGVVHCTALVPQSPHREAGSSPRPER